MQFLFDASDRAKSYQFQTTDDPNGGVWKDYDPASSTRDVVAQGLPRGERCLGPRPRHRPEQHQERLERSGDGLGDLSPVAAAVPAAISGGAGASPAGYGNRCRLPYKFSILRRQQPAILALQLLRHPRRERARAVPPARACGSEPGSARHRSGLSRPAGGDGALFPCRRRALSPPPDAGAASNKAPLSPATICSRAMRSLMRR